MTKADMIVMEARSWLGTPFAWGQRCKGVGVDCAQLIYACLEAAGLKLGDTMVYSRDVDLIARVEAVLSEHCQEVPVSEMVAGDIIVIRTRALPQHGGICIGNGEAIHAATVTGGDSSGHAKGSVVKLPLSDQWMGRIHKVYRYV